MDGYPDSLLWLRASIHEAGHCVATYACGGRVLRATMHDRATAFPMVDSDLPGRRAPAQVAQELLMICLAGILAESHWLRRRDLGPMSLGELLANRPYDLANARACSRSHQDWQRAKADLRRLYSHPSAWLAVMTVANELLEAADGSLSGERVMAICRQYDH